MAESDRKKSLVIVESPAKARTIGRFLGPDYTVEASIGHVRDLPEGKKQVPEKFKQEDWAYLGVNVDEDFEPIYIVPPGKKQQVSKLRSLLKESKDLLLATDEDREGEAISWHLHEVLKPKVPVKRLVFHEITEEAIRESLANPRDIDSGLVRAQETRRILDRLYGYDISQLLWRKIGKGLSAGRVQSVAVRMVVERERDRMAFHTATYWDLVGQFAKLDGAEFRAELVSVDERKIPSGSDFDSTTGKLKDESLMLLDEPAANALAERLKSAEFRVAGLEVKPYTDNPKPPFTTSTLQQQANIKLGFTARRTMNVAQSLYENGYITYMRTDSTNLASVAIDAARDLVRSEYGEEYLPEKPRSYSSKVKNAQEAHEAIRPAGHPFALPESLKDKLNKDEFKLFDLIWKRTVASQMESARGRRITITVEGDGAVFRVSGKTIDFPGYLRAFVEGSEDPSAQLADKETVLPSVEEGEAIKCLGLDSVSHTTKPPARFTEASLTRRLEERGIGRPSTYATIIDTILGREYVFKKGSALVPTWRAFAVARLMEEHFHQLVDYEFTAEMENLLDEISRGEAEPVKYLNDFYFGEEDPGLKRQVEQNLEAIDARAISQFLIGEPDGAPPVYLRVGRYGPFIEQGERDTENHRKASVPAELPPDELTLELALELLAKSENDDEPLGVDPETGLKVFVKQGRFGPYVQLEAEGEKGKPKNAGLLKGMEATDVSLETALQLLSLPRELGPHPESGDMVEAANGRYGPYVKCGSETRSLPPEMSPLEVSLKQALELLAQPKTRGRRAAPKEPLKSFDKPSPVTEQPVKILDGRYGPYATDGETNASLPRDVSPDDMTFEKCLDLLAERAAKGGGKKKKKKKAAKKKTAKKKTAKKKTAKKKSAKKKTAKKKTAKKKSAE